MSARVLFRSQTYLAGVLFAAACTNASPIGTQPSAAAASAVADLGQEFALDNGQSVAVGPNTLELRFERVTTDNRCPVGDPCASAGDAVVLITVRQTRADETRLELHTNPADGPSAGVAGALRIRLVKLEPRPVGEQPVPLPRYTATFVVSP